MKATRATTQGRAVLIVALALFTTPVRSAEPLAVWMDVDPSVMRGGFEPDDGLALVQAFRSPELVVRGVSAVHGNSPVEQGYPIAREIVERYGPTGLAVHRGAASADERGIATGASTALASALRAEPLTILALGPATNVATVLLREPDLAERIVAVVAVAGRRPGQHFVIGEGYRPLMDLNFDLDPEAFEIILDAGVPLVLAPFEISVKVPLHAEGDLDSLAGTAFAEYFEAPIRDYVQWYDERMGVRAIYPFDALAVGYLTSPDWFACDALPTVIRTAPDDVEVGATKPYLLADATFESPWTVTYCHTAAAPFKADLLRRLRGDEAPMRSATPTP